MKLFYLYVLAVPYVYQNWIGLAIGLGMIVALILGLYLRSVMTKDLFEKVLTLICGISMTGTVYAALEAFVYYLDKGANNHRIAAMFSHPNYFGTIAATVILICVYKFLTERENKWFYFVAAGMNVISLYLCKSMFAFIEVFIGVVVLLIVLKKFRLFLLWISTACIGVYVIFFAGIDLIPRLNDVSVTIMLRQHIWSMAIDAIKSNPIFGHGFMSFGYLFHASYKNNMIPHSHSIYLDLLLNFGIVGSIFFLWYFAKYYIAVIKSFYQKNNAAASLILAVTVAALVHGATDLTLLWIQTLPLFLLILAGQGAEEKEEQFARGIEML